MLGRGQPLPSSAQHFSTGHWTQTTQKRGEAKFYNLDSSKTAVKWVFAKLLAAGISPWEICLQGLGLSGVCLRFGVLAELSVLLHGSVSWALSVQSPGREQRWGSDGERSRTGRAEVGIQGREEQRWGSNALHVPESALCHFRGFKVTQFCGAAFWFCSPINIEY